jgi:hypothetical protein
LGSKTSLHFISGILELYDLGNAEAHGKAVGVIVPRKRSSKTGRPIEQRPLRQNFGQRSKEAAFLLGVRCGAKVAAELVEAGWTDLQKLENEVFRRVRGK